MTVEQPTESVAIGFTYDRQYRENVVRDGEPDSWIDISIRVGETYIYGDENSGVTGFACNTVLNFLDSVTALLHDEKFVVEFDYGPSWLLLEPTSEKTIAITRCSTPAAVSDPDKRLDVDITGQTSKRNWAREVVRSADEFQGTVIDWNPELRTSDELTTIRTKVSDCKELLEEFDKT